MDRRSHKAHLLLQPAVASCGGIWADLGCGEGVFTQLLAAMLLQPGSEIYAVDKDRQALDRLRRNIAESETPIWPILADFTGPLSLPALDGLVMANSLHFVREKKPLLTRLIRLLRPGGRLVVIEYNTNRGNYAVPYPLTDTEFLALANEVGLDQAQIVARVPSSFLGQQYTGIGQAAQR
jgi:trans-aconitate methyltransferase